MYIFYSGATAQTGRTLRGLLGIAGGSRGPERTEDVVIRWGNSGQIARKPRRVLNKRDAILHASDKLRALQSMIAAHIPCPRIYTRPDQIHDYPVLGRQTHHTQGRDVALCLQARDVIAAVNRGSTHFTQYIPKAAEYRVHVFNNEVIKISHKVLTEEANYSPVVWNFDNGFTYRKPRELNKALRRRLEHSALAAVEALGLDFGAADVVVGDDGVVYVLEVNTGPSLAENSVRLYARKFAQVLNLQVQVPDEDPNNDDDL